MSESENESTVLKGFEAFNRQDIDALMESITDDFKYDSVTRYRLDKEEYRKFMDVLYTAFSDFRIRVNRMVSQGNTVVAETTITGTHKSEYLGIPATGKSIELPAVYICDLEAGKVKLMKYYANLQSLLRQLRE
jgi:steroid delta-isomerase-like uncharacterized protein